MISWSPFSIVSAFASSLVLAIRSRPGYVTWLRFRLMFERKHKEIWETSLTSLRSSFILLGTMFCLQALIAGFRLAALHLSRPSSTLERMSLSLTRSTLRSSFDGLVAQAAQFLLLTILLAFF